MGRLAERFGGHYHSDERRKYEQQSCTLHADLQ